ncbi:MAG TPA: methyltransferase domain-containing protein, partial [Rhodanobacteraceae bacterium]
MTTLVTFSNASHTSDARPTAVDYVLGSTPHEHRRLMSQARLVEPYTERFLRDAGISEGDHVLDVGCGMGDVAMILARLVGPSGAVTGIDRDAPALEAARSRVAAVGYGNVEFVQADIA